MERGRNSTIKSKSNLVSGEIPASSPSPRLPPTHALTTTWENSPDPLRDLFFCASQQFLESWQESKTRVQISVGAFWSPFPSQPFQVDNIGSKAGRMGLQWTMQFAYYLAARQPGNKRPPCHNTWPRSLPWFSWNVSCLKVLQEAEEWSWLWPIFQLY